MKSSPQQEVPMQQRLQIWPGPARPCGPAQAHPGQGQRIMQAFPGCRHGLSLRSGAPGQQTAAERQRHVAERQSQAVDKLLRPVAERQRPVAGRRRLVASWRRRRPRGPCWLPRHRSVKIIAGGISQSPVPNCSAVASPPTPAAPGPASKFSGSSPAEPQPRHASPSKGNN
jgi:hypothetical protein